MTSLFSSVGPNDNIHVWSSRNRYQEVNTKISSLLDNPRSIRESNNYKVLQDLAAKAYSQFNDDTALGLSSYQVGTDDYTSLSGRFDKCNVETRKIFRRINNLCDAILVPPKNSRFEAFVKIVLRVTELALGFFTGAMAYFQFLKLPLETIPPLKPLAITLGLAGISLFLLKKGLESIQPRPMSKENITKELTEIKRDISDFLSQNEDFLFARGQE
ncbi:MAG: hypothetical protein Tsb0021_06220 [Chlamydiales bacterium]